MATLQEIYAKLEQDDFRVGYVQAFDERGMPEILAGLNWDTFQGNSYRFEIEKALPTGSAARDPMDNTTAPPNAEGDFHDIYIYPGQLLREFTVPIHGETVLSGTNDQLAIRAKQNAQSMFKEFLREIIHGDGSRQISRTYNPNIKGQHLQGWDFYLDMYAGRYIEGVHNTTNCWYNEEFKGQKIFATASGAPDWRVENQDILTYDHLDRGLSMLKHGHDRAVAIMNLDSWLRIVKTAKAEGGNTGRMQLWDSTVFSYVYEGFPVLISDTVGAKKESAAGGTIAAGALNTLVVNDDAFIGFTDFDIGRVVTVATADFSGAAGHSDTGLADNQAYISQIVDNRTVILSHAAGSAITTGKKVVVEKTNAIYLADFSADDRPIAVRYGATEAATPEKYNADAGRYYGTIAGFNVYKKGVLGKGAFNYYNAQWDGMQVVEDPFKLVRISNFKLA